MTTSPSGILRSRALLAGAAAVLALLAAVTPARPAAPALTPVNGVVTDGDDRPAAGATVEAKSPLGAVQTTTDEGGRFEL